MAGVHLCCHVVYVVVAGVGVDVVDVGGESGSAMTEVPVMLSLMALGSLILMDLIRKDEIEIVMILMAMKLRSYWKTLIPELKEKTIVASNSFAVVAVVAVVDDEIYATDGDAGVGVAAVAGVVLGVVVETDVDAEVGVSEMVVGTDIPEMRIVYLHGGIVQDDVIAAADGGDGVAVAAAAVVVVELDA
ncbi:hypothetical protein BGZ46_008649 [Entomortierella lignicola]|nr:hypothetical protein BGZ46_008649 [Entomortierella lignicola]